MSLQIDFTNLQNNNLLLLDAVQRGDLSTVLSIIGLGVNLQQISGLVYSAVYFQRNDLVWNLLCHGANLNEADRNGITPLILAIQLQNIEIIDILIYDGAEVNAQTFQYASHYGVLPYVQRALANLANSDEESDETDQEADQELADFSPSPSNSIEELTQQLFLAIQQGDNDRLEAVLLVRNIDQNELLNARDENNNTPLMLAIIQKDSAIIETLIATDASVDDEVRELARRNGVLNMLEEALYVAGADSENRMSP